MQQLYRDPGFIFRFTENRIVPRIHVEGVEAGVPVCIYKIDTVSGERLGLLYMGNVDVGGWIALPEPIVVKAGDAFVAVCGE